MCPTTSSSGIRSWPVEDRPREKLTLQGIHSLTDTELLAIILGTGSQETSAVGLARQMLSQYEYDLVSFAQVDLSTLMKTKGVGKAKAISIKAAIEFGRRSMLASVDEKQFISGSQDAYDVISKYLGHQCMKNAGCCTSIEPIE